MTWFYGSSCANNDKGALTTPEGTHQGLSRGVLTGSSVRGVAWQAPLNPRKPALRSAPRRKAGCWTVCGGPPPPLPAARLPRPPLWSQGSPLPSLKHLRTSTSSTSSVPRVASDPDSAATPCINGARP
eukprot:1194033-Prorocentrum_minimum.AAC.2